MEKPVFLNLNYEHNPKRRLIKIKLEPKNLVKEKSPKGLRMVYIGEKERLSSIEIERNFPPKNPLRASHFESTDSTASHRIKPKKFTNDRHLQDYDSTSSKRAKSRGEFRDFLRSNRENQEKVIIITDKDFFKPKENKLPSAFPSTNKNKTDKNFYKKEELGPIDIQNFKHTNSKFYNYNTSKPKQKMSSAPLKNTFIKERTLSFHDFTNPSRYDPHFSFVKEVNRNISTNIRDFPVGKRMRDYTRSNVHIDDILSRIDFFSKKHEMNAYNGFNEYIKIDHLKN